LQYNTLQSKWINFQPSFITATSADNLQNKTISYINNLISVDLLRGVQIQNAPSSVNQVLLSNALGTQCTWNNIPAQAFGGLTDVLLTSLTSNDFIIWNGVKWINTSSINYVTLSGSQTLQNKTIDNTNNVVQASKIRSVVISNTAPTAGQWLQATDSTNASWTNIVDSTFIIQDNISQSKKMQFELSEISNATTRVMTVPDKNGTICMLSDLADSTLLNKSSQQIQVAQTNAVVSPTYSDTISPCLFIDSGILALQTPTQGNDSQLHTLGQIVNMCTNAGNLTDNIALTGGVPTFRINVGFIAAVRLKTVGFYSTNGWNNSTLAISINGYTSMQTGTGALTGGTQLFTATVTNQPINVEYVANISTSSQFQYYSIYGSRTGGTGPMNIYRFPMNAVVGSSYSPLFKGTDYTRSVNTTTGLPTFTKTVATAQDIIYNLNNVVVQEVYDRILPMIQSNLIKMTGAACKLDMSAGTGTTEITMPSNYQGRIVGCSYIDTYRYQMQYDNADGQGGISLGWYQGLGTGSGSYRFKFNYLSHFINDITYTRNFGAITLNNVWKITNAATKTMTLGPLNLSELGDVSISGATVNDILTYNGMAWVHKDDVTLGSAGTVKLSSTEADTLTVGSSTNRVIKLAPTSLLWSIKMNDEKVQIYGSNLANANSNNMITRIDNEDLISLQTGSIPGIATMNMNAYITNVQGIKARGCYETNVVNPPAGAYTMSVNDNIILRFTAANSQHVTLPFSGFIFPGYHVKIIMGPGASGTIFVNTADVGGQINDNNTSVNMPQKICRTYTYIGIIVGVAQWWYDN
jgi:hypothetical protein